MNADCDSLTERVIGAILEVANTLGAGFLEKVYERALLKELKVRGIQAASQAAFAVVYKGQCVGEYYADILVENMSLPPRQLPETNRRVETRGPEV
jgi:GxxExxY protein